MSVLGHVEHDQHFELTHKGEMLSENAIGRSTLFEFWQVFWTSRTIVSSGSKNMPPEFSELSKKMLYRLYNRPWTT